MDSLLLRLLADPGLGLRHENHEGLEISEAEGRRILPLAVSVLVGPHEGRVVKLALLASVFPNRSLERAAAKRGGWFVGLSCHVLAPFV